MRVLLCRIGLLACLWMVSPAGAAARDQMASANSRLPNVVILYADDLGYGDLGCYGARDLKTPNLDRMAKEGVRFTSFYVSQPVCSASRASLLTGCYANRVGIHGALGPKAKVGLAPEEMTLAELVKPRGYATAIYGKWHLGDAPTLLPPRQGFDEYFGLPYSNDMWPFHPEAAQGTYPDLPLIEGDRVVATNPDQRQLTRWYTERGVRFLEQHRDQPFLLYLAYAMPHVPLFVSDRFQGRSKRGLYGDVVMEIDWSAGEILRALKRLKLERDTLVMFISDNGPWLSYGHHAGSAGPLREGKGTVWEGGVRVPCIARWPGRIPARAVCEEPAMTIDVFPTVAKLTGAQLPAHPIDGRDIWSLLARQPGARSPHDAYFFYYHTGELQAVRSGPWKLYLPHTSRTLGGRPGGREGIPAQYETTKVGLSLFNLQNDVAERHDVLAQHPEVVASLMPLVARCRQELGDALTGVKGQGVRPAGRP